MSGFASPVRANSVDDDAESRALHSVRDFSQEKTISPQGVQQCLEGAGAASSFRSAKTLLEPQNGTRHRLSSGMNTQKVSDHGYTLCALQSLPSAHRRADLLLPARHFSSSGENGQNVSDQTLCALQSLPSAHSPDAGGIFGQSVVVVRKAVAERRPR